MTPPANSARTPRLPRRSPFLVAAVLSALIYTVLGYVLSAEPPATLPAGVARALTFVPHLIAVINASSLVCLRAGRRAAREGRIAAHRRLMLAAATLISMFLVLYVTRVALGGVKAFAGPALVRRYVYLPMLSIHVLLSILSVPPVIYNLVIGLTHPVAEIARTKHPRVGRIAVAVWSVSLVLGIGVYLLLIVLY